MFTKGNEKGIITWDDEQQVLILKKKIIPLNDIKAVKLYTSGIETTVDDLVRRLNPQTNYLDYFAMTSLEVELYLKSKARPEQITYYKIPFQASEKE
ncbi:MAG: hypothetical protein WAW70_05615 [Streptococcus parauberis]